MVSDTPTERYQHLIQANSEAAEKLLPRKTKRKDRVIAKDPWVATARERVNKAFEKKAETLDNSMDTYTKEIDGFEITLADGYYPLEIAKFDESEWK